DEVMAVLMRAPSTYTREDVAELHCHGGMACASAVLSRALNLGARVAAPGEFTKRAFMNGRIDLAKAEAVMQLIGAGSQAAARASLRQLQGGVSSFVKQVSDRLTGMLAQIEACTDFPDEVDEEATAAELTGGLENLIHEIETRCDARGARILREGASIVLAGRPNVGKSSLMNALLNQERAIVTDVPGTTRDVLTERLSLGGVAAELSDTAGQRDTLDPVERIGVDRARRAVENADVVLIVLDAAEALCPEDEALIRSADDRAIVCLNKTDLRPALQKRDIEAMTPARILELSAQTGAGVDALIDELTRRVAVEQVDGTLTAQRHIALALDAAKSLRSAIDAIEAGFPLDTAAIDLREALSSLGEITGENATEAVIDRVFAAFCVGK
ncbi:MAG: tRNA uridine-5-carboxymethylaminomethyl(34) synthesis GTPase MnmE, partial [bacterium]